MKASGWKDSEKKTTDGLRTASQQLVQETWHLRWQILLVGSGFWLAAIVCIERFIAAYAEALEQRPRSESVHAEQWGGHLVGKMRRKLVRAARRCGQRAEGWRQRAEQIDMALLERRA